MNKDKYGEWSDNELKSIQSQIKDYGKLGKKELLERLKKSLIAKHEIMFPQIIMFHSINNEFMKIHTMDMQAIQQAYELKYTDFDKQEKILWTRIDDEYAFINGVFKKRVIQNDAKEE